MKDSFERQQKYYELGESYFWFASHYDTVMTFVKPLLKKKSQSRKLKILDVGCGPGNLIARLIPWGEVVGIDASKDAVTFCQRKHDICIQQGLIQNMPFADNTFDFIFCVDMLEHIEDDFEAMRELYRVIKPDGFLIVTVPAFMCLWGYNDVRYGHVRRYTRFQISKLSKQAGFKVKRCCYFKFLFFLPLWFLRRFKKISGQKTDDCYKPVPIINKLLRALLRAEIPIVYKTNLPVGASLITVLSK